MNDEAKKLIQEQYAKLPAELKKAIQSAHLHEQIELIGKKNQLHIDQVGLLEDETLMLMMGFTNPDDFADQLAHELKLEKVKAIGVANDVGEDIMTPIRTSLEKSTEEKSVVMPSSAAKIFAPATPSTVKPAVPPTVPTPPSPSTDVMLTQPTVSMAGKIEPPKPVAPYKADPYREPTE